jgi:aminoglycoside phosphotransferase (APT) family kinase protein
MKSRPRHVTDSTTTLLITKDTNREMFRRLFGRDGAFANVRPIHRSFGKLTWRLSAPSQSDLVLQVWLLDEEVRAQALAAQFGLNLEVVHRLWQYGSRHVVDNTRSLSEYGIAVPPIRLADDSRSLLPYDFVIYDFINGETLHSRRLRCAEPEARRLELAMARTLGQLHALQRAWPGSVSGDDTAGFVCHEACLDQVRSNVSHSASGSIIADQGSNVLDKMERLSEQLRPREIFSATHGDLQPGHYLVDADERIWLIDLELVKFFDVEYDISRFGLTMGLTSDEFKQEYSRHLKSPAEGNRVRFYELYWLVSSIAFLDRAAQDSANFTSEPLRRQLETTLRDTLASFAVQPDEDAGS